MPTSRRRRGAAATTLRGLSERVPIPIDQRDRDSVLLFYTSYSVNPKSTSAAMRWISCIRFEGLLLGFVPQGRRAGCPHPAGGVALQPHRWRGVSERVPIPIDQRDRDSAVLFYTLYSVNPKSTSAAMRWISCVRFEGFCLDSSHKAVGRDAHIPPAARRRSHNADAV